MTDLLVYVLPLLLVVGTFFAGVFSGKRSAETKATKKELENAKEVLSVKPSDSVDAALDRLSRNGKLLPSEPPKH